jgi:hypothetical protein
MCKDVTNEGNDCADCCLSDNAVCRPVHLDEKRNRGQCTYGPANRSESHMLNAERCKNVATGHNEKAGEPRSTKFFDGRTDKSGRTQIIGSKCTEMMVCHSTVLIIRRSSTQA